MCKCVCLCVCVCVCVREWHTHTDYLRKRVRARRARGIDPKKICTKNLQALVRVMQSEKSCNEAKKRKIPKADENKQGPNAIKCMNIFF